VEGALHGNLKYQSDLYSADTARAMTDAYLAILRAVVDQPRTRVADLTRLDWDDFEV
jgi:hypothetical protein